LRTNAVVVTLLCLVAPAAHAADYVMRPVDLTTIAPTRPTAQAAPALAEKVDSPSNLLVVPYYEVDTVTPAGGGPTTLFAIHNLKSQPLFAVSIFYISRTGQIHKEQPSIIGTHATYTRNVRDVKGLPVDKDGFARGFVRVVTGDPESSKALSGDFFQVDPRNNFATGDRMIQGADLCYHGEVRLVDFGVGTDLRLFINLPQGGDPNTDPESARLLMYDEAGVLQKGWDFFTSSHVLFVNTDDLNLPDSFGLLDLSFEHSGRGYAYAVYSAEGRYSVGMNWACLD